MVKVASASKLYQKAILNDIIEKIEKMDLEENTVKLIKEKLNEKRKRKMPIIDQDKQCKSICKSGEKCKTALCYDNKCWAHLTKDEREIYRKMKENK